MIQRVQTVYLLIAAVLLLVFLGFVDVWLALAGDAFGWVGAAVYGLGGVTTLVALGAIFLYKQRARQERMIAAAQWLDLALFAVLAGVVGVLAFTTDADLTVAGALGYTVMLMPVVAYVALRMARLGVRKDIDLVRSMDRLR